MCCRPGGGAVRVEVRGHINCAVVRSALEPSDAYSHKKEESLQLKITGGGGGGGGDVAAYFLLVRVRVVMFLF